MNNLRDILLKEGMSSAELSRYSGINANTISKIYNCKDKGITDSTKGKVTKGINSKVGYDKYEIQSIFPDLIKK